MVIATPKLSLPPDLPYKKRQRPFNPNTSLQQATVRYNEALRKQYNDVQFANRYENGYISQNELTSVNTIDIGKNIEPELFTEMSNLNPLPVVRQRKSRKIFISCGGNHLTSTGSNGSSCIKGSSCCGRAVTCGINVQQQQPPQQYYSDVAAASTGIPPLMSLSVNPGEIPGIDNGNFLNKGCAGSSSVGDKGQGSQNNPQQGQTIDCNNTEMFPHLLSTVGNNNNLMGNPITQLGTVGKTGYW